jgi:hypothetical protein
MYTAVPSNFKACLVSDLASYNSIITVFRQAEKEHFFFGLKDAQTQGLR